MESRVLTKELLLNRNTRNFLIWSTLILTLFVSVDMITRKVSAPPVTPMAYSQFIEAVQNDQVKEVTFQGDVITGLTQQGVAFSTRTPYGDSPVQLLLGHGVLVKTKAPESGVSFWHILISLLPLLLIASLFIFSFRQMRAGGGKAMGFGGPSVKKAEDRKIKITFDDVAGVNEAKQELRETVDFLKDPQKFQRLGGKIPKGCLLVGPPGTGKTLLAKAVAGEAGVPFFSIAGSDFVEVFVGVGASRVRELFAQAKKNSPCIIFIDEIDAVGRRRGSHYGGGNEEREQTLNQLLVEMDGFDDAQTIIVLAATNRVDILDRALLRPGRFDRRVVVPIPDLRGREEILKVHLKKVPLAPNVKVEIVARGTPGFSGADLANLVNEAALLAAGRGKLAVGMQELEEAKDKVLMGAERRTLVINEESKRSTAYHEAGHAIVAFYAPKADPLHKATIIPRGEALGMVVQLPQDDKTDLTYEGALSDIMVAAGGRVAEELIFGADNISTGAASDIRAATYKARRMVSEWGMSPQIGFMNCNLGENSFDREFSEATTQLIDKEVRRILDECYQKAKDILSERRPQLDILAKALLERETLTGEEIKILCEGGELPPLALDASNEDVSAPEEIPQIQRKRRGRKKANPEPELLPPATTESSGEETLR